MAFLAKGKWKAKQPVDSEAVPFKTNRRLAFACSVASKLVVKPSLKRELLEAAERLRSLDDVAERELGRQAE